MERKLAAVELDYYEELGVEANASTLDIQKAYKRLARLLHPDRHRDPALRKAVSAQMRRLNSIVRILEDPRSRALYDCRSGPAPPPSARRPDWKLAALTGLFASALTFALCGGLGRGPAPLVQAVPALAAQALSPEPATPVPQIRKPPARNRPESPLRSAQPALIAQKPEIVDEPKLAAAVVTSDPAHGSALAEKAPGHDRPPPAPAYSGSWFYTGSGRASTALYQPEYIQLDLSEDEAGLRGTYRARFHVPDRPLSPEVEFRLAGHPTGQAASFEWIGKAGAKGEGTLRLISDQRIEVQWYATVAGAEPGLGAAVSILTRQVKP